MLQDIVRYGLALWLALLLTSVTLGSAYLAVFARPGMNTGWIGQIVYRFGQGVILVTILLSIGGLFGLGAALVLGSR
jgi:hypothetical protein